MGARKAWYIGFSGDLASRQQIMGANEPEDDMVVVVENSYLSY